MYDGTFGIANQEPDNYKSNFEKFFGRSIFYCVSPAKITIVKQLLFIAVTCFY